MPFMTLHQLPVGFKDGFPKTLILWVFCFLKPELGMRDVVFAQPLTIAFQGFQNLHLEFRVTHRISRDIQLLA